MTRKDITYLNKSKETFRIKMEKWKVYYPI